MALNATGGLTGRPRNKEWDWDEFEMLCEFQCTQKEVADFFKTDRHELIRR